MTKAACFRAIRDVALIYCGIAAAALAASALIFARDYIQNDRYKQAKAALISSDLSQITIEGLKPGTEIGTLSEGAFAYGDDGSQYIGVGADKADGVVIASITGDLFWKKTSSIEYRGQPLNTKAAIAYNGDYSAKLANSAITAVLGENYYSLIQNGRTASVVYRDQVILNSANSADKIF